MKKCIVFIMIVVSVSLSFGQIRAEDEYGKVRITIYHDYPPNGREVLLIGTYMDGRTGEEFVPIPLEEESTGRWAFSDVFDPGTVFSYLIQRDGVEGGATSATYYERGDNENLFIVDVDLQMEVESSREYYFTDHRPDKDKLLESLTSYPEYKTKTDMRNDLTHTDMVDLLDNMSFRYRHKLPRIENIDNVPWVWGLRAGNPATLEDDFNPVHLELNVDFASAMNTIVFNGNGSLLHNGENIDAFGAYAAIYFDYQGMQLFSGASQNFGVSMMGGGIPVLLAGILGTATSAMPFYGIFLTGLIETVFKLDRDWIDEHQAMTLAASYSSENEGDWRSGFVHNFERIVTRYGSLSYELSGFNLWVSVLSKLGPTFESEFGIAEGDSFNPFEPAVDSETGDLLWHPYLKSLEADINLLAITADMVGFFIDRDAALNLSYLSQPTRRIGEVFDLYEKIGAELLQIPLGGFRFEGGYTTESFGDEEMRLARFGLNYILWEGFTFGASLKYPHDNENAAYYTGKKLLYEGNVEWKLSESLLLVLEGGLDAEFPEEPEYFSSVTFGAIDPDWLGTAFQWNLQYDDQNEILKNELIGSFNFKGNRPADYRTWMMHLGMNTLTQEAQTDYSFDFGLTMSF